LYFIFIFRLTHLHQTDINISELFHLPIRYSLPKKY